MKIGDYWACSAGFSTEDFGDPVPDDVERSQVEIVKSVFAQCRPTRTVQPDEYLTIGWLKHDVERLTRRGYISRGAVLVAAAEMGINILPVFGEDGPADEGFSPISAFVGINRRDVDRLLREVRA
ncbi:UNVERIFIED_ORG: hypothetical protein M2193_006527 [Bradyrhizobium japonicum]|uniref:hypothetical protein n=1 Tax=Bradyrhizobium diazoefficiens TaxID=1355477 RepID=UPI00272AD6F2|nr:hypothetical protein [Bradyrhizobium diazoefficiens]WLA58536.1 hypothetical protein QIH81_07705 [Bradyrhizobium diazoefficiens]